MISSSSAFVSGIFLSPSRTDSAPMCSLNPGAGKMNTKWIDSFPILIMEIQVLAGINTVAPPCTFREESPRLTPTFTPHFAIHFLASSVTLSSSRNAICQLFFRSHNKTLSVAAMCVSKPLYLNVQIVGISYDSTRAHYNEAALTSEDLTSQYLATPFSKSVTRFPRCCQLVEIIRVGIYYDYRFSRT